MVLNLTAVEFELQRQFLLLGNSHYIDDRQCASYIIVMFNWSCYKLMLFNEYFWISKPFSFPSQPVNFLSFGQSYPQLFQLPCKGQGGNLNFQSMPPAIMKHINWSRAKRGNRVEYRWCLFCCLAHWNSFLKKFLRIW